MDGSRKKVFGHVPVPEEKQRVFRSIFIVLIIFGMVGLVVGLVMGLTETIESRISAKFPTVYSVARNASHAMLFVGDSFTYFNEGVNRHMELLAASGSPRRTVAADRATEGGATLQRLWSLSFVRQTIAMGHFWADEQMAYDYVVIQDDIPEYTSHNMDYFYTYVKLFVGEIRNKKTHPAAEPVLLMAWAYTRLPWVSLDQIAAAHRTIANELGIQVAPVGLAFRRSLQQRPALAMLGGDAEHETVHGTYLAACTVWMTILGDSITTDFSYVPDGVSAEEGVFLRSVARDSVLSWRAGSNTGDR